MIGIDRRLLQNVDWPLIGTGLGFAVLSGLTLSNLHIGRAGGTVALRQLLWFGIGLVALLVVASIDYKKLVRIAPLIYLLGLAALAAVFVLGRTVSGARRWIVIGSVSVQPSELFKIAFVLMAVWVLTSRWAQPINRFTPLLVAPVVAIPFVLVM